jgi:hypothetical protein
MRWKRHPSDEADVRGWRLMLVNQSLEPTANRFTRLAEPTRAPELRLANFWFLGVVTEQLVSKQ